MTKQQKSQGFGILLDEINNAIEGQITEKLLEAKKEIQAELDKLHSQQPTVVIQGRKKTEIKGLKHKQLDTLLKVVGIDQNALLVGSAGSGKTKAGQQVAEALKLDFYAISVGSQTSKSDILGYMDASGKYVQTEFRKAYEKGGVFLMDEIDAGNSNVLIVLNSALANGLCAFPDKMVKKHKDFRFIGTANTYGNGANRQYVGRNQLDSATLDRFTIIDWEIDETLEKNLISSYESGEYWHAVIKKIRDYIKRNEIRAIVSPRATMKGVQLLGLGFTLEETLEMCVFGQVPEDKIHNVRKEAQSVPKPQYEKKEETKEEKKEVEDYQLPF